MNVGLMLKGAAMGIAEAIPGVSGGTIALITGIYEELLETIKSLHPRHLKLVLHDPKEFWTKINGQFLAFLLVGMALGLVFGIVVISHALEHYKMVLWAFFFGLVLASALYLGRQIHWDIKTVIFWLLGVIGAYLLTVLAPVEASDSALYLFLSGVIAISALMLPGLSGSFMLLILGLYDHIINGLKGLIFEQDWSQLIPIATFSLGALVGLFSFARVLSYLFKTFPRLTMAAMIGFLIGSLPKLWPWKEIITVYDKESNMVISGESIPQNLDLESFKILSEVNLLPSQYTQIGDPQVLLVSVALSVGFVLVGLLSMTTSKA